MKFRSFLVISLVSMLVVSPVTANNNTVTGSPEEGYPGDAAQKTTNQSDNRRRMDKGPAAGERSESSASRGRNGAGAAGSQGSGSSGSDAAPKPR